MFSRRDLFLGLTSLALPSPTRRRCTVDLLIGRHVRAVLEDVDVEALTGIRAEQMRPLRAGDSPWLTLRLDRRRATLELESGARALVWLPNGAEAFVTSWALPLMVPGLIGFDPGRDLPPLVTNATGTYWPLEESALPGSLTSSRAVYATFFGNFEPATLQRMSTVVETWSARLPSSADFVIADASISRHRPRVLATVFTAEGSSPFDAGDTT